MRVRKVKGAKEKLNSNPSVVIANPAANKGKWKEIFGNDNPIFIEIGTGKGQFITKHAVLNPNINYIGIEKTDSVLIRALEKVEELKIPNLLLICMDAKKLAEVFASNEVGRIYLNFSDPWPKARHEKRRLTDKSFLEIYKMFLNGSIQFKTDSKELYQFTLITLNESKMRIIDSSFDLHSEHDGIITTEYEDKFVGLKKPIYYLEAIF